MCCPVARILETRLLRRRGEASGGRLQHWGHAALELRQVRRGSARVPLRGNPGRVSTSKAPGKVSREPDSAVTCVSSANLEAASKVAGIAGAVTAKALPHPSPPLTSCR
ncbi:hypothetical protein NDU88_007013 [Pleurodeles waltl]|uniref:Uncharacterized protein n=1 Tax=Pleurodeles waltl TaxID=8319 RepID=A0AAV7QLP4_PLEWA|nr:hypothetical protein NDU88_007013 [Pleurodeles waltl]